MTDKLTAEQILDQFEGQVDGGFHWPYDGPRVATVVGTKVEPDTYDGSRLEVTLTLVVEDDEKPDHQVAYSIGNISTFESPDGVTIAGIDGARMRDNAWYQKFNNTLVGQDPCKTAIIERGMGPLNSQYCVGLKAEFEPIVIEFGKDKDTKKAIVGTRPLPTKFIAFVDTDAPAAAAPVAATAGTSEPDIMATLKALAASMADNQAFMTAALPIAPSDMAASIADGSLFAQLKG